MLEADLRSWLLMQPEITARIGTRCYPMRLPQDVVFPALTYQAISGSSPVSHEGGTGIAQKRIQFDCWGERYDDALALAGALRTALSGVLTSMGGTPSVAGRIVNDLDVSEPEPSLWRRMIETALWYTE